MASFIEVHEVWCDKVRRTYLNSNLITDVGESWNPPQFQTRANAQISMISLDGENNPLVFRVTETIDEIMEKIQ